MKRMIRTPVRRACVPALCLLLSLSVGAWAQGGRIAGRVVAKDTGEPLIGASVEVTGPNLTKRVGAMSDVRGHYAVENLPAGRYTVRAKFVGYEDRTVEGVEVAGGGSAQAEVRMTAAPYELGEIVVSASRRAENVVDAPASISRVEAREIERNPAGNSFVSAIKNVKGIDYTQTGILTEAFNTRGFNDALNGRMVLFVDGRFASPAAARSIAIPVTRDDFQDVEVVTGPGSALYGPDVVSGVINITTKDPRDSQGTTFAVAGGSRSIFKGRFRHAGLRDRWGWKVSGEVQRARDFEKVNRFFNADSSISVTDDPDFNAMNLRGGLGLFYYPDEGSRLGFMAGASLTEQVELVNSGRYQLKNNVNDNYQQMTYTSPHLYLNAYHAIVEDTGDSYNLQTRAQNVVAGVSPEEAMRRARSDGKIVRLGGEGRYHFGIPHLKNTHFNAGTDFRQERWKANILSGGKIVSSQIGFYGHAESDIGQKARVVMASRADFHEVYGVRLSPKAALIFKPHPTTAFRVTFNRAFRSPNVLQQRLLLLISPTVAGRGNDKGFKFGSAAGNPLPPEFADGIPQLKPEDNTTLELGFKGVLAGKVFLDVSGYKSWYKDFISPLRPVGNLARGIVTLDESGDLRKNEQTLTYINFWRRRVWGWDLGANVYVTDRVTFKSNVSIIEAGALKEAGGILQPFNTPRTIFNLGLSVDDFLTRKAALDASLRHVSKFDFRSGVHVGTVPTYTVADLHLGYRTKYGFTYRLSVTNAFDKEHVEMVDGARIGRIVVWEMQYAF